MPTRPLFLNRASLPPAAASDLPALRRTAELFRLLLEHSADTLVEIARTGEILYLSPNALRALGYTVGDLLHQNLFALLHPEERALAQARLLRPKSRTLSRLRQKDGTWRWLEFSSREPLAGLPSVRLVLFIRDVTERVDTEASQRQLERKLQQSAKLTTLGMLAGGIAHDFNNMLTAIGCHLNLAQSEAAHPKVQASLAHIEQAVGQAKQLARQILEFNRRQPADYRLLHLPAAVSEAVELLRPTWRADLTVVTDLPADTGWILANPPQIQQVILNLLLNAVQAIAAAPGRLELRVDPLTVTAPYAEPHPALARGRYVRLTIRDSGHGMDAATQRRIFEPFFTTKPAGQGTGLGLAVVQRVLSEHGASIELQSTVGVGTSFHLYFTAQADPSRSPALPP